MPTETETPVTAESPKGAAAFEAARTSARASATEEETPQAATPSEEPPPAGEPEKPADLPEEPGEPQDAPLTEAELQALPEADRAKVVKWQARYTQRDMALAAKRKEIEDWLPVIEALKTNPDAAIEQLATSRGLKLAKEAAVAQKTAETLAELPEDLQFLKPVFEAYGQKLLNTVRSEVAPLKQATDQIVTQAVAAETDATLEKFEAKHPDWRKHEAAMVALGAKVLPGPDTTDSEYMETLFTLVTAKTNEAEKAKAVVAKINEAAGKSEEKKTGVSDSRVSQTIPPNFASLDNAQRMKLAHEAAKNGIVWEK